MEIATDLKIPGKAVIARRHTFSSAHRYVQPKLSHEENQKQFGLCYLENSHGHNYVIEAFVEGTVDVRTGLIADVIEIDKILKSICEPLDHHNLNLDVEYFAKNIPTTENLALYFFGKINSALAVSHPSLKLNRIKLSETDDLWSEVWA